MHETIIEAQCNGLEEQYVFSKVARHANGSVLYRQGKAVLIATVVADEKPVDEPFLPLTVQYIEKAYAAAKIPGGFIKRESKPSDFETLTSRIVDRSVRPLFPEGFSHPIVITVMVVSSDETVDLQVAAIHAASAALTVSDLPVHRSVAAVRVGRIDGALVINPPLDRQEHSSLDLLVAGSGEEALMIEMAVRASEKVDEVLPQETDLELAMGPMPMVTAHQETNAVEEEELVEILAKATEAIAQASGIYRERMAELKKSVRFSVDRLQEPERELTEFIEERLGERIRAALRPLSKSERSGALREIVEEARALLKEYAKEVDAPELEKAVERIKRRYVRRQIIEEGVRADGRRLDEVRPISIETNILPGVHGSCLFTRGQTQALVTATLGEGREGQIYELLTDRAPRNEHFMVHYNFPGFSVGEAKPIGAPGRRELGHGNLAKRALEPVLDLRFSRTVRLVSEILESNGSSSMATVCGGALALASAQVEIVELVAGVAMGLVLEGDRHAILTDIMGLEDHDGDMDFKVAGTRSGITALQMDVKPGGLDPKILAQALKQARKARLEILDLMEKAREQIRPSGALPFEEHFHVDPSKIAAIIGKAGATIRDIIERFEVTIDLDRKQGGVRIVGREAQKVKAAREHIHGIANAPEPKVPIYRPGESYRGTIKRIVDYGLFVELPGGHDALLHQSKMPEEEARNFRERFREGEEIEVRVLAQNGRKVELARPGYSERRS